MSGLAGFFSSSHLPNINKALLKNELLKRGENYKDLIGANFLCGVINKYQKNKSDFVFIKNEILINFDGRIDNTILLKTLVGANLSKNINDAELVYLLYKKMELVLERIRGPCSSHKRSKF